MPERHSNKKKTLIIVRHAHRFKPKGGATDNGLSAKGRKQARKAAKHFRGIFDDRVALFVTSPKRRCVETLLPFVDGDQKKLHIAVDLDEGGQLVRKAEKFIKWWRDDAPDLTVICSHGDWIPLALEKLVGAEIDLKKGGWAEVEVENARAPAKLTWLRQEF